MALNIAVLTPIPRAREGVEHLSYEQSNLSHGGSSSNDRQPGSKPGTSVSRFFKFLYQPAAALRGARQLCIPARIERTLLHPCRGSSRSASSHRRT
jgi:hypothetical protein